MSCQIAIFDNPIFFLTYFVHFQDAKGIVMAILILGHPIVRNTTVYLMMVKGCVI